MSIINTNTISQNAQRNLSANSATLATTIQRLSSGLRINSAKDDAAGLAISERFSTQIRGLNQATRNANDGISLSQTTEGALSEIGNNLQRIRELAVQARNFTNSASDRAALQAEVALRLAEVDRTASQTSFNGQKVLDGSFQNAAFQIGANAGETISVSINANARLSALGKVASASSTDLGAGAAGGAITRTASSLNFGTAAANATSGRTSEFAVSTLNFGTATAGAVAGSVSFTAAAFDFRNGSNTTAAITDFDFSGGAANVAQFNVTVGATTASITLDQNYTDAATLAAAVQTQIQATTGLSNVTVAEGSVANTLVFSNAGSAVAVAIGSTDTNAGTAGFANTAGTAGSLQPNGTFTVGDGTDSANVVLNGNYTNVAGLVAELNTQFTAQGSEFLAAVGTGNIVNITNVGANTAAAVNISAANASANQGGVVNATGTAGSAATTDNSAAFTVDGNAVLLDQDYADYAALAADIESQIGASNFNVGVNGTGLTISRATTGAGSTAVAIGGADAEAVAAGIANQAGLAGANAVTSTNASFQVDGTTITLNGNYADGTALRAAIAGQLSGYTVSGTGSDVVITNDAEGSAAVSITNADPNAFNSGFTNGAGTAGAVGGSITLGSGDLSINGTAITGTFADRSALTSFINANVQGVFASTDGSPGIDLKSASDMTLAGTRATSFGGTSFQATDGSLTGLSVQTTAGADDALLRIDSALGVINGARADLGAVQNRFESVIANLGSAVENLSASRSRIRDADYAKETAELTRTQILQQAGTAMLAQANQIPQNVLSLLR